MHTGMLWFDNDPSTNLSQKIQKAIDYYKKKFGHIPNLCLVHPSMFDSGVNLDSLTIRPYRPVMPGHLWIGIEEEKK